VVVSVTSMQECDRQTDGHTRFDRWRGVVASVVRRMNEVALRLSRLALGWVTVFGRVYHHGKNVTSQLDQLSLASLWGR